MTKVITDSPKLYVGTYAKYNNGSIAGAWLDLTEYADKDKFLAACRELHEDEADPEFMFQDFECFPHELYSESYVDERIFQYADMDERDRELVAEYENAVGDLPSDLEDAVGAYFTELSSWNKEREFGEYIIDEGLFGIEVPDALQGYINYEAIGRDWLMDYSVSEHGFVFGSI